MLSSNLAGYFEFLKTSSYKRIFFEKTLTIDNFMLFVINSVI